MRLSKRVDNLSQQRAAHYDAFIARITAALPQQVQRIVDTTDNDRYLADAQKIDTTTNDRDDTLDSWLDTVLHRELLVAPTFDPYSEYYEQLKTKAMQNLNHDNYYKQIEAAYIVLAITAARVWQ